MVTMMIYFTRSNAVILLTTIRMKFYYHRMKNLMANLMICYKNFLEIFLITLTTECWVLHKLFGAIVMFVPQLKYKGIHNDPSPTKKKLELNTHDNSHNTANTHEVQSLMICCIYNQQMGLPMVQIILGFMTVQRRVFLYLELICQTLKVPLAGMSANHLSKEVCTLLIMFTHQ